MRRKILLWAASPGYSARIMLKWWLIFCVPCWVIFGAIFPLGSVFRWWLIASAIYWGIPALILLHFQLRFPPPSLTLSYFAKVWLACWLQVGVVYWLVIGLSAPASFGFRWWLIGSAVYWGVLFLIVLFFRLVIRAPS